MCKAVIGSEGPSCLAHWMDSPRPVEGVIFVQGRSNLMTSRPWRSETDETAEHMMCLAGSNALRFVTVNLPRRATHQKHTAMHAKIAASRGWSRDSICLRDAMMSVVKGARRDVWRRGVQAWLLLPGTASECPGQPATVGRGACARPVGLQHSWKGWLQRMRLHNRRGRQALVGQEQGSALAPGCSVGHRKRERLGAPLRRRLLWNLATRH